METMSLVEIIIFFGLFFPLHFFIPATMAYLILWKAGKNRYLTKKIQKEGPSTNIKHEILLSISSMLIFAALMTAVITFKKYGLTQLYFDINEFGWGYFFVSLFILALVQDVYHYYYHLLMHVSQPLYKHIHSVHHRFINTTPFTAYALHPLEVLGEMAYLGILVFIIPLNIYAIIIYSAILSIFNIISHLGYEFYPDWIKRYFVTSTGHNIHHQDGTKNLMLYFPVWDRLHKTLKE